MSIVGLIPFLITIKKVYRVSARYNLRTAQRSELVHGFSSANQYALVGYAIFPEAEYVRLSN